MAGRGRPTVYTDDAAGEILERIRSGESLRSICEDEHLPSKGAVLHWVTDDREGFADRYADACYVRAMGWAEETVDIADNITGDTQRDRLRVDTRKWFVSKLLPAYADKVELGGPGGGPVQVAVTRSIVEPDGDT